MRRGAGGRLCAAADTPPLAGAAGSRPCRRPALRGSPALGSQASSAPGAFPARGWRWVRRLWACPVVLVSEVDRPTLLLP